jgi:hypothetical protein
VDLQRLFKATVIANTVLYVAWVALPWVDGPFLSSDTVDALSWSGAGAILPLPRGAFWLLSCLYVMAAVGLCGFIRGARWLFVSLAIFQYGWVLFSGVNIETPLQAFISRVNTLADGAIIALAFLPGVREKFDQ